MIIYVYIYTDKNEEIICVKEEEKKLESKINLFKIVDTDNQYEIDELIREIIFTKTFLNLNELYKVLSDNSDITLTSFLQSVTEVLDEIRF